MESLRFIHAADLHLDSPFRGLANTSTKLRDELQAATLGAFARVNTKLLRSCFIWHRRQRLDSEVGLGEPGYR